MKPDNTTIHLNGVRFRFRGDRNYVQGSDLYNAFVDMLKREFGPNGNFSMTMHSLISHQCNLQYCLWSASVARPVHFKAEFNCVYGNEKLLGWLTETHEPINERYPYDEESIMEKCIVSDKEVFLRESSVYTAVETLIAMNKHLHQSLFPTIKGKWLLARLELNRFLQPDDVGRLRLKLLHGQLPLTKSKIWSGDEFLGNIYFWMVKP